MNCKVCGVYGFVKMDEHLSELLCYWCRLDLSSPRPRKLRISPHEFARLLPKGVSRDDAETLYRQYNESRITNPALFIAQEVGREQVA